MVESVQMESTRARYGLTTLRVVNWSQGLQGGETPVLSLVHHEEGFLLLSTPPLSNPIIENSLPTGAISKGKQKARADSELETVCFSGAV